MKFSKKDRLVSRSDFAAVFDAAHLPSGSLKTILHGEHFIVYRKSGTQPRLGISVSRRVIRKANDRNRIKRCVREFFRMNKNKLHGDYVVRVVSRPLSENFDILTKPLMALFLSPPGSTGRTKP